ncbi:hypothetical protein [Natronococcus jeotgali]|nr:hypothetical protein [Natronococcus jeotgali]
MSPELGLLEQLLLVVGLLASVGALVEEARWHTDRAGAGDGFEDGGAE